MKKELDEKLCKAFPLLYADRNASKYTTCMCWGFPGDGWFEIIWELSDSLEKIIAATPTPETCRCRHKDSLHTLDNNLCYGVQKRYVSSKEPGIIKLAEEEFVCDCTSFVPNTMRAAQVKEKFGGLRFYLDGGTEEQRDAAEVFISAAEEKSLVTCEHCGKPGTLGGARWLKTFCTECREVDKK